MIGYHTSHLNDTRKAARKTRSRPSISDSDMHGLCDISAQVSLCNVLINHHHHHLRSSASHPCGGEGGKIPATHMVALHLASFSPRSEATPSSLSLSRSLSHSHTARTTNKQNKQTKETPGSLVFFSFLLWLMESSVHLTLFPFSPTELTYEQGGLLIQ